VQPNQSQRWFTFNWPASKQIIWTVVPDSVNVSAAEITYTVAVQLASATAVTYWITITNLTNAAVDIEARYAILN
jgi:hypothetical protein